jgi:hypothetical protein
VNVKPHLHVIEEVILPGQSGSGSFEQDSSGFSENVQYILQHETCQFPHAHLQSIATTRNLPVYANAC